VQTTEVYRIDRIFSIYSSGSSASIPDATGANKRVLFMKDGAMTFLSSEIRESINSLYPVFILYIFIFILL
jgi:hypothetical protein